MQWLVGWQEGRQGRDSFQFQFVPISNIGNFQTTILFVSLSVTDWTEPFIITKLSSSSVCLCSQHQDWEVCHLLKRIKPMPNDYSSQAQTYGMNFTLPLDIHFLTADFFSGSLCRIQLIGCKIHSIIQMISPQFPNRIKIPQVLHNNSNTLQLHINDELDFCGLVTVGKLERMWQKIISYNFSPPGKFKISIEKKHRKQC